jgi:hypothetical protein
MDVRHHRTEPGCAPDVSALHLPASDHDGVTSERAVQADQGEEKRNCHGLVISEADWLSTAHPDGAMVMPSADT